MATDRKLRAAFDEIVQHCSTEAERIEQSLAALRAYRKLLVLGFTEEELGLMFQGYQLSLKLAKPEGPPATDLLPMTTERREEQFLARVRVLFPDACLEFGPGDAPQILIHTGLPVSRLQEPETCEDIPVPGTSLP